MTHNTYFIRSGFHQLLRLLSFSLEISWTSGSSTDSVCMSCGSLLSRISSYPDKLCSIYSWTNGSTHATKSAARSDVVNMGTIPMPTVSPPPINSVPNTHNVPN